MRYHKIPEETVRRMPLYLRASLELAGQGADRLSSRQLGDYLGLNPWLIRKDFSYFGDLGRRGVGYDTQVLISRIKRILRLDVGRKAVLVGVGRLGSALLEYGGFGRYSLQIVAAFDRDRKRVGTTIGGVRVEHADGLATVKSRGIDMGIIAVPEQAAQEVANTILKAGIQGILSFSPRHIVTPRKVKVITIDIAMDLARLPYYLSGNRK
ncbi:MAG: redox-sensing transcriptional repressor Rex [Planctomycetes bacterium RBG_13_60_9]|nr:MAG: redox-sensing transcriptional repressor Rex [Planctomycetes bacterium RBG_13_60_9]